jgi:hypothetical protein
MGLSNKEEVQIWETMMARRRRLGPDPEDYPSIRRRMEHEFVSILLIINWILKKLSDGSEGTFKIASTGRRLNASHILLILITLLGIATTTLSWLSLQSAQIDAEARKINIKRDNYLRTAYLGKAVYKEITVDIFPESYTLKFNTDTKGEVSITIPHDIPKEEYKSLFKK